MTIAAAVSTNHSCSLTLAKRIKFTPTSACPISTTTKDWISSFDYYYFDIIMQQKPTTAIYRGVCKLYSNSFYDKVYMRSRNQQCKTSLHRVP